MINRFCLTCLLTGSLLLGSAQVYNVARFSTDAGLGQSQVMALLQDQYGYLWLGTHRGAARFDGRNFSNYEPKDGLVDKFLSDLAEDPTGRLWLASERGLSYLEGGAFTNFTTDNGLIENGITALMVDRQGVLWIAGETGNLSRWQQGKFQHNPFDWAARPPELGLLSLLEDDEGLLWLGTNEGLYRVNPAAEQPLIEAVTLNDQPALAIYDLLEDRLGYIWAATPSGVFRVNYPSVEHFPLGEAVFPNHVVFCMAEAQDGVIWLGTGQGIIRYQDGHFFPLRNKERALDFEMRSVEIDQEGSIWFGTDGGGVIKITEGVFETYNMQDGLSSNIAKSFLQDQQNRIWISTRSRGVNLFLDGRIVRQYDESTGMGGDRICTSYEDRSGNFWFASFNGTLTRYDGTNFQVYEDRHGLDCGAAFCVAEDQQGRLWVGTDNGIFLKQGESFIHQYHQDNGLRDNVIYSLIQDGAGNWWIGSAEGLSKLSGETFHHFPTSDSLGTTVITSMIDPQGRVWVGSSVGLTLIEQDRPQWIKISGAPGAHTVVGLVTEQQRFLWVGTENGAYRLDLTQFELGKKAPFELYAQKDGLPSLECNANAAFEDRQGNIWLGTAEGAIRRPAGTVRQEDVDPPRIYITSIEAAGQMGSWLQQGYTLDKQGLPIGLELPYTDNRVTFEYIGVSLKSPQQVEYRFMLEGVDGDWLRPTRQTRVFYPNLDPGAYTFKVAAKKETKSWEDASVASFSFAIQPPLWQRSWFILLCLLGLGALGFAWYRVRRRLQEEQRLKDQAEKLQLEHQALYAMMNPHFTFNALQSIQFFIHRQDRKSANKFLSSFAKLVRKNLESTRSDVISLGEEVERLNLYLALEKMRFPEKFDYELSVDPEIDLHETQLPPMLLQPFVENSIKHGIMPLDADGHIRVLITQRDEEYLSILIEDNGIGIEASKQQKQDRPSDHVSKGMQITLDRLALFARMSHKKYDLDIHEIKGENGKVLGTRVEMILPLQM